LFIFSSLEIVLGKQTLVELQQNPVVLKALHAIMNGNKTSNTLYSLSNSLFFILVYYDPCTYNPTPFIMKTGLNKFTIQCEIIHKTINDHSPIPCCPDVRAWNSIEFTECK
jgi:hypothetical protein